MTNSTPATETGVTTPTWSPWRLSRVDVVGASLGMGLGFLAAGPLMWLAAEARRVEHFELTPAGRFASWQLLVMWLASSLIGIYLACVLARVIVGPRRATPRRWPQAALWLALGSMMVAIAASLLPALILGALAGSRDLAGDLYLIAGSFVGWQSGLVAFVFLYTFRWLEQIRRTREVAS